MTKITLELETCKKCPHHMSSPYPTDDSFERPEYYWCKCSDVDEEHKGPDAVDERKRLFIKEDYKLKKLNYVIGYIEWRDRPAIPDWCPLKIKKDE